MIALLLLLLAAPAPVEPAPELVEATIADLAHRMTDGRETARSLVDKYLARIAALDASGPRLRSILEVSSAARAEADALDRERKTRGPRGPLHGIPIVLKDSIEAAAPLHTTAGSTALEGVVAPADAFVVTRLRAAGAVILGKANLSEWANIRSTHSSSGWSALGGQTRNPYAIDRSPSGSSSGSAVAVAANLAAAAVGTETDGSIVSPAQVNGVVGLKPTLGLVSRSGIVPIASSQDTAGPMARTVTDAAILLGAMVGVDPSDPATRDAERLGRRDYRPFLDAKGLRGARIGVVRGKLWGYSPAADRVAEAALAVLRAQGAVIVDPVELPMLAELDPGELEVLLFELKAELARYLARLGPAAPVRTLGDVIRWNTQHADRELVHFGQELFELAAAKGSLEDPAYRAHRERIKRRAGREGIDALMDRHRLDALVAPTGGPAWLIDLVSGDAPSGSASSMAAVAGYPHITVPAGHFRGLPLGLSFFGRAFSEPVLIKLAYAYEQASHARRAPRYLPTVELPGPR